MAPQDSEHTVTSCVHSTLFAQNTGLGGYEVQRPSTAWEGGKSRLRGLCLLRVFSLSHPSVEAAGKRELVRGEQDFMALSLFWFS